MDRLQLDAVSIHFRRDWEVTTYLQLVFLDLILKSRDFTHVCELSLLRQYPLKGDLWKILLHSKRVTVDISSTTGVCPVPEEAVVRKASGKIIWFYGCGRDRTQKAMVLKNNQSGWRLVRRPGRINHHDGNIWLRPGNSYRHLPAV